MAKHVIQMVDGHVQCIQGLVLLIDVKLQDVKHIIHVMIQHVELTHIMNVQIQRVALMYIIDVKQQDVKNIILVKTMLALVKHTIQAQHPVDVIHGEIMEAGLMHQVVQQEKALIMEQLQIVEQYIVKALKKCFFLYKILYFWYNKNGD